MARTQQASKWVLAGLSVALVGSLAAAQDQQRANLAPLINETLAINNKSAPRQPALAGHQDEWTFDMVEYDLMDFLQDLSVRYANSSEPQALAGRNQTATKAPELPSTSLAEANAVGEHEVAESSWQYGIFDRFTRPKSSSTTTPTPDDPLVEAANSLNRNYNGAECGLRTYSEQAEQSEQQQQYFPQEEASKELSIRRQRPLLSPVERKKTHAEVPADSASGWDAQINAAVDAAIAAATNDKLDDNDDIHAPTTTSRPQDENLEFNLASRRHWLQQQLGNTLHLLGLNSTGGSISSASQLNALEPANQKRADNWSLNKRENMMKMSGKLGKALPAQSAPEQQPTAADSLAARQDELKLEARVIGGTDARLGDSPWSVSLQALVSRPGTGAVEYRHYCGGTIIADYYVLTAAHCLDFMVGRESRLFVVVGDLNWRMSTGSLHGRRFGIEKLIIHSGYKSTAFGHDIGLIRTKEPMRPVKVNGRYVINSVCLPERGVEHQGEAELVGWGLFSNRNEMADSLQIADVPILPRSLCVDLYRRRTGLIQWLIGIELITDKQVCAGTFGRGICQGDSGSALVVNERLNSALATAAKSALKQAKTLRSSPAVSSRHQHQSRATQIGIVAFGGIRRCSYQSLPGVYMQTSKYMDWILPRIQD